MRDGLLPMYQIVYNDQFFFIEKDIKLYNTWCNNVQRNQVTLNQVRFQQFLFPNAFQISRRIEEKSIFWFFSSNKGEYFKFIFKEAVFIFHRLCIKLMDLGGMVDNVRHSTCKIYGGFSKLLGTHRSNRNLYEFVFRYQRQAYRLFISIIWWDLPYNEVYHHAWRPSENCLWPFLWLGLRQASSL